MRDPDCVFEALEMPAKALCKISSAAAIREAPIAAQSAKSCDVSARRRLKGLETSEVYFPPVAAAALALLAVASAKPNPLARCRGHGLIHWNRSR
jgi:hypothetical protein